MKPQLLCIGGIADGWTVPDEGRRIVRRKFETFIEVPASGRPEPEEVVKILESVYEKEQIRGWVKTFYVYKDVKISLDAMLGRLISKYRKED